MSIIAMIRTLVLFLIRLRLEGSFSQPPPDPGESFPGGLPECAPRDEIRWQVEGSGVPSAPPLAPREVVFPVVFFCFSLVVEACTRGDTRLGEFLVGVLGRPLRTRQKDTPRSLACACCVPVVCMCVGG